MWTSPPNSLVSCFAALAAAVFSAPTVGQTVRFAESFDYGVSAPTHIGGLDGGVGWIAPWTGTSQSVQGIGTIWPMEGGGLGFPIIQIIGVPMNGASYVSTPPPAVGRGQALQLVAANQQYMDVSGTGGQGAASYANFMRGTIAMWFRTNNTAEQVLFSASSTTEGSQTLELGLRDRQIYFDVAGAVYHAIENTKTNTPRGYTDGRWHHVALVVPGSGWPELYVDGARPEGATEFPEGFFGHLKDPDKMLIGALTTTAGTQSFFDGLIDEVAIWGVPLSEPEVASLAAGRTPGAEVPGPLQPSSGPHVVSGSLTSAAYRTYGLQSYGGKYSDTTGDRSWRSLTQSPGGFIIGAPIGGTGWTTKQDVTQYMSFLVRRDDRGGPIRGGWLQFADQRRSSMILGWNSTGRWEGGIEFPLEESGPTVPLMQDQTTYFVVVKLLGTRFRNGDMVWAKFYSPGETVHNSETELVEIGGGVDEWNIFMDEAGLSAGDDMWILHGGTGLNSGVLEIDEIRVGDTWDSVTKAYFGAGCGGAQIGTTGRPVLGSTISIDLSGAAPNNIGVLMLGVDATTFGGAPLPLSLASIGAVGCELNVSPVSYITSPTNGSGQASRSLRIRNAMFWLTSPVYAQWLAFDPNPRASWHNPSGLIFTPGMELGFQFR